MKKGDLQHIWTLESPAGLWLGLNNYYLNCIKAVDNNIVQILDELHALGITDNTIVMLTADHGEVAGAHGLNGKGSTAYKEQNNVPLIISHPAYRGSKKCKVVTSHVDIAPTLISLAGGDPGMIDAEEIIELLEDHQGYIPESVEEDILNSIYNGNWTDAVEQMLESNITPNSLVDYIEDYRFEVCPGSYEWFTLEHAVSLTSLYGEVRSREAA